MTPPGALKAKGRSVVAYGATAKSASVANFCELGPELISFVTDTTPVKQGRLTPGSHIPMRGPEALRESYPDIAVLFVWNCAVETMAQADDFAAACGRCIQ